MGTSPLYSLSLCWWDDEDNKALEDSEIQYIRLGHRGVHRAKGMCPPRTHTPTSRSLSRWLKVPFHDLYGPLPQAVFPMGPSTGVWSTVYMDLIPRLCSLWWDHPLECALLGPRDGQRWPFAGDVDGAWTGASSLVPVRVLEATDSWR